MHNSLIKKRSIKSLEYQKQRYPPTVKSGIKEMEKKCMKKRGEAGEIRRGGESSSSCPRGLSLACG